MNEYLSNDYFQPQISFLNSSPIFPADNSITPRNAWLFYQRVLDSSFYNPFFFIHQADSLSLLSTPRASVNSPVQALVMGVLTDFSLPLELKYSTKSSLSDGHCSPLRDVSLFPRLWLPQPPNWCPVFTLWIFPSIFYSFTHTFIQEMLSELLFYAKQSWYWIQDKPDWSQWKATFLLEGFSEKKKAGKKEHDIFE